MAQETWNNFFKKRGRYYLIPHPQTPKIISKLRSFRVKTVLDLGCGSGRHAIALTKAGFTLTGIDFSEEAISLARKWAKQEKVKINFKRGDFHKKLPFKDKSFDATIAISALQFQDTEALQYTISEVHRVLKDRGIIFLTLPLSAVSKEITHLVFTEEQIESMLAKYFSSHDHFIDKQKHYCVFGVKSR